MLSEEALALAVSEAKEEHIDIAKRHLAGKAQVCVAIESLVHVGNAVAGIALAVDEDDLCIRMVDEQADELAGCIAGSAKYSYSYHELLFLLLFYSLSPGCMP